MIIDKVYKIILWIYPLVLLWVPEELFVINRVLGVSLLGLYFIRIVLSPTKPDNIYVKFGLFFFSVILISLILNQSFNFININIAVKYVTPLIVAAYAFQFLKPIFFFKLFRAYMFIFIGIWLFRMVQFGFPLTRVMSMRDELWWEKAVVVGFLYAAFYFGYFLTHPYFLKPKHYRKYLFLLPLFFIGGRSLVIGAACCLFVFMLTDLKVTLKKIKFIFLIGITSGVSFSFLIFNYIKNNAFLSYILGSQRSLNIDEELTINTFSSGRTDVWGIYFDGVSYEQVLFGYGGLYEKAGISLHNDFLEMFFYYGILAIIGYLFFFYKVYLSPALKSTNYMFFALFTFLQIQVLFNPFTSTMSTVYFLLIFVLLNKVHAKV